MFNIFKSRDLSSAEINILLAVKDRPSTLSEVICRSGEPKSYVIDSLSGMNKWISRSKSKRGMLCVPRQKYEYLLNNKGRSKLMKELKKNS